jgi:outer membrane protein assembly factor BamA
MDRATPATPCQVHRVLVRGAQHTHESVIKQELRALGAATTLGEIHQVCALAAARLEALAVFDSADFTVDRARADGAAGDLPLADVIVTVSEKKRLASASTGVHTSGGEGSMDAEVRVRTGPSRLWAAGPRSMRR